MPFDLRGEYKKNERGGPGFGPRKKKEKVSRRKKRNERMIEEGFPSLKGGKKEGMRGGGGRTLLGGGGGMPVARERILGFKKDYPFKPKSPSSQISTP